MNDSIRNTGNNVSSHTVSSQFASLTDTLNSKRASVSYQHVSNSPASHNLAMDESGRCLLEVKTDSEADIQCLFSRIEKFGKPAILTRINVQITGSMTDRLSQLLSHAAELNVRMAHLSVGVCTQTSGQYYFSLHGLFQENVTAENISRFLSTITQDMSTLFAYARVSNLQLH